MRFLIEAAGAGGRGGGNQAGVYGSAASGFDWLTGSLGFGASRAPCSRDGCQISVKN